MSAFSPLPGVVRRTAGNLRRALRLGVYRGGMPRRGRFWLRLRLGSGLGEMRVPGAFGAGRGLGLLEVLQALAAAAHDTDVCGVLVELEGGVGGWSRRQALRRALAALRAQGKAVVVYADTLDTGDLFLASAASTLWIAPAGGVHLTGLRLEGLFLRGLLDRLAVEADVVRVGTHKGAGEMFTREAMSPEQREQLEALLDDLFGGLVEAVAEGRRLPAERVRALVDEGLFSAEAAQAAGLVDGTRYPDELEAGIRELVPAAPDKPVALSTFWSRRVSDPGWLPLLREPPRVAYLVARGAIRRGRGRRGITTTAMRAMLRRVREDERVRGVVLRLESPGGDGLASDLIWRELQLLARAKPLVVSMGDVAASGGYYLAAAGGSVLAEAGTLTGSIGVVGGKLSLAGLYEKLGVGREALERGARAGLFSATRPFTPGERAALRSEMERVYQTFVARVAEGRRLGPEAVERVAQGRVWSGTRAHALGLVDALGGPLEALREVARRAGLGEHERLVVEVHPRLPPFAVLRAWIGIALAGWLDAGGP